MAVTYFRHYIILSTARPIVRPAASSCLLLLRHRSPSPRSHHPRFHWPRFTTGWNWTERIASPPALSALLSFMYNDSSCVQHTSVYSVGLVLIQGFILLHFLFFLFFFIWAPRKMAIASYTFLTSGAGLWFFVWRDFFFMGLIFMGPLFFSHGCISLWGFLVGDRAEQRGLKKTEGN